MNDQNGWIDAALTPLRKWLPSEPRIEGPDDLRKAVEGSIGRAIRADREAMWNRLAGKRVLFRHPSGLSFWVRLGDGMSLYVIRSEKDDVATRFVLSRLSQGGTFLDVGANTGWFAIRAAARYRDLGGGSVHAFEPQPVMSSLIADSIAENGLGDVLTLHRMAVGDRDQTVFMQTPMNSGGSTVRFKERDDTAAVEMKRLDSLSLAPERVDIIKMDIEGAEPMFVRGAAEFLSKYRPAIYSEVHPRKLERVSQCSREDYIAQMEALGYRTMSIGRGDTTVPFDRAELEDKDKLINVVFEPA